ncbi:hypothetical protein GCM10027436_60500 [Actinophytocola sediminis]
MMANECGDPDRPRTPGLLPPHPERGDRPPADPAALLDALTPRQREIIRLRVVVGLSAQETAERLGMAPAAVRLAQHRALNHLRAAVGQLPG